MNVNKLSLKKKKKKEKRTIRYVTLSNYLISANMIYTLKAARFPTSRSSGPTTRN